MTFLSLPSSLEYRQRSWLYAWFVRWCGALVSAIASCLSQSVSQPCSVSRSIPARLPFSSVLWRVMLLVAGMGLGFANFVADLHYTRGSRTLNYTELVKAARDYPLSHHYRFGPAQVAVRDSVWE